jgi:hypothetical protein
VLSSKIYAAIFVCKCRPGTQKEETMDKLDPIEIAILKAVGEGRGGTEVPSDAEDSGHTSWLLEKGYIEFDNGALVLTEQGHAAVATWGKG